MTQKKDDNEAPTFALQVLCVIALVVLFGISAYYKRDVPFQIYAIIFGVLFGVSNIKKLLGGGK